MIMLQTLPWAAVFLERWAKNYAALQIIHHKSFLVKSANIKIIIVK